MSSITVTQEHQLLITPEIGKSLDLKPGQKFEIFNLDGVIQLVPVRPLEEMRGFLKGMSTEGLREKKDRIL